MSDASAIVAGMAQALGLPGCAVALAAPGREDIILWGVGDSGSGRPVDGETWFQAASTGKHVTACAVLALAAEGAIDVHGPIGRILTDVPPAWADRSILSLLRHTSGIPEYLAYADGEVVPEARSAFMARFASLSPMADEGTAWSYSNTNYILLGFLVAQCAGVSYAAHVERLMGHRGAIVASPAWVRQANAQSGVRTGHDPDSARREVIGDGDIAFTASGALAWLRTLLAGRSDPLLFEPALLASGRRSPYACGWFIDRLGDAAVAHHAGHFDGFTAMALLNRSAGCGAIVLANLAPGNTRAVRAIAQAALEAFAPGTTPLALRPSADARPDLTATARRQLIRPDDVIDRACFAPELQLAIDRGGPVRGVLNLWAGEEPQSFALVEEWPDGDGRMRRYRLTYGGRVEHVLVGTGSDDTIHWAWPL